MPSIGDFLDRGLMPKEAPTPFRVQGFGAMASTPPSSLTDVPRICELSRHMLARPGLMARQLGVPHPHPYFKLSGEIVQNWSVIIAKINSASLSVTRPVDDPQGTRAVIPNQGMDRTELRAQMRALSRYVLHADVSQCYPSIYTHSLAWALHGKSVAKIVKDDSLVGNRIDRWVRYGQDGQTIGVPVGPDTSLVLSELVLSQVDVRLESRGLVGFRYIDDYELYFSNRQAAEQGIAELIAALADYELALNSRKTTIAVLPQPLQEDWVSQLRRTDLRARAREERSDLTLLFDDAFRLAALNSGQFVVSYALGRLGARIEEKTDLVAPDNWPYLQKLLLQACWAQPTAIHKAVSLLAWGPANGLPLDREIAEQAINRLIVEHAQLRNSSEVAWALWAAVSLRLRVRAQAAKYLVGFEDDLVALVSLHLHRRGLLPRGFDRSPWSALLTPAQLMGPRWLLAYEAAVKGSLVASAGDHIASVPFFDATRSAGVTFYDDSAVVPSAPPRVVISPFVRGGLYG